MTPEDVVQKQLDAYNARDLDTYMSCFTEDIVAIDFHSGEQMLVGAQAFRERYKEIFDSSPQLHCKLVNRILLNNMVFDREIVTGRLGVDIFELVAIYEIEGNLINKVTFVK